MRWAENLLDFLLRRVRTDDHRSSLRTYALIESLLIRRLSPRRRPGRTPGPAETVESRLLLSGTQLANSAFVSINSENALLSANAPVSSQSNPQLISNSDPSETVVDNVSALTESQSLQLNMFPNLAGNELKASSGQASVAAPVTVDTWPSWFPEILDITWSGLAAPQGSAGADSSLPGLSIPPGYTDSAATDSGIVQVLTPPDLIAAESLDPFLGMSDAVGRSSGLGSYSDANTADTPELYSGVAGPEYSSFHESLDAAETTDSSLADARLAGSSDGSSVALGMNHAIDGAGLVSRSDLPVFLSAGPVDIAALNAGNFPDWSESDLLKHRRVSTDSRFRELSVEASLLARGDGTQIPGEKVAGEAGIHHRSRRGHVAGLRNARATNVALKISRSAFAILSGNVGIRPGDSESISVQSNRFLLDSVILQHGSELSISGGFNEQPGTSQQPAGTAGRFNTSDTGAASGSVVRNRRQRGDRQPAVSQPVTILLPDEHAAVLPERPDAAAFPRQLRYIHQARAPPDDSVSPLVRRLNRDVRADQLRRLRHSIAPRGPSLVSADSLKRVSQSISEPELKLTVRHIC